MDRQGLIILYTGNGKGKTTAALGQVLRAAGHGLRCCVIQFIKSGRQTGEAKALSRFGELVEFHIAGTGFTWQQEPAVVRQAALQGWQLAAEKIRSGRYDLIVLDELTYLLHLEILSVAEVLTLLQHRPAGLHLLLTGRGAPPDLVAAADLVTEMQEIKHPYQTGGKARKGIEF